MDSNKAQKKLTVVIGVGNPIELKGSFGRGGERKATLVSFDDTSVSILSPYSMFVNGKQVPEVIKFSTIDSILKNGSEVPDIPDFYEFPSKPDDFKFWNDGYLKAHFVTGVLKNIYFEEVSEYVDYDKVGVFDPLSAERAIEFVAYFRRKITPEEAVMLDAALEFKISPGDYIMLVAAFERALVGFSFSK
jgi:hypothetical protein